MNAGLLVGVFWERRLGVGGVDGHDVAGKDGGSE